MTSCNDLPPRLLSTFLALAKEGSFTQAAQRLHLTQSAVSRHISALEQQLQTQLIVRSTHSMRLTPAGRAVLPHARQVLQALDDLSQAARGLQTSPAIPVPAQRPPKRSMVELPPR